MWEHSNSYSRPSFSFVVAVAASFGFPIDEADPLVVSMLHGLLLGSDAPKPLPSGFCSALFSKRFPRSIPAPFPWATLSTWSAEDPLMQPALATS